MLHKNKQELAVEHRVLSHKPLSLVKYVAKNIVSWI